MSPPKAPKTLLDDSEGKDVQTLYVRLTNGTTLLFIGPPLSDDDFMRIENVLFGDIIPQNLLPLAAKQGATTTAQ
jgi:hypothetical protein